MGMTDLSRFLRPLVTSNMAGCDRVLGAQSLHSEKFPDGLGRAAAIVSGRMKIKRRRPADLLLATSDRPAPAGFVSLEFLPFEVRPEDWRPAWAERGARRKQWETLTSSERLAVLKLLGLPVPERKRLRAGDTTVAKGKASALKKLKLESKADLLELHRSAGIALQQRMWADDPRRLE